jgi:hypothetical protein
MTTNTGLRSVWCVLTGIVLVVAAMPSGSAIYQGIVSLDSSRWVHFLAYAVVSAIPVAAWRRRSAVLLSLCGVAIGMLLEGLQPLISGFHGRPLNLLADVFGVGAGILLGLNLRMMRTSPDSAQVSSEVLPGQH